MNIKQKQIYSLLIYIAVNVFFVFYTVYALNNSEINWRMYGGIVIIPFFVVSLWLFCNFSIKLSSFTSIIFILCYVLHFGQIVVKVFNPGKRFVKGVLPFSNELRHKQYHIFIMLFDHNQSGTDCGLYFGNDIFPLNKGINRRCVFRQYLP